MLAERVLMSVGKGAGRVFRPPMADGVASDHYVGDAGPIRKHEQAMGIIPTTLDTQIESTRLFIEQTLRS